MSNNCETCGIALDNTNSPFGWGRCNEHWRCDDCGTKENLCMRHKELTCHSCHAKRMTKKVKAFKGDTDYTNEITCPWCGFKYSDSWERNYDNEEDICEDCGNAFEYHRFTQVTYSTSKVIKKE